MAQGLKAWSFNIAGRRYTVRFHDILLLEIRKVSEGSYQPVLAFFDELEGFVPQHG